MEKLNEDFIINLSNNKGEPLWMKNFRLNSYKKFLEHFTAYLIISLVVLVLLSFNPLYILLATVVLSNVFLNLFRFRVSKF